MCQKEQSEKSRLLDKEVIPVFGEIKFKYPKWVAYSILMVIILTHIYSVVSSLYVVNQYAYSAFMKARYPHRKSQSFNEDNSACARDTNSEAYKEQIVVQKVTTEWNIYCALAQNIPGILVNLNLATYSDVYGRKPFFLVPLVGTFLKNLFCTFGIYFEINMQYFIVFYFIEGCTGIWASTLSMAFCFIADTTEPGKTRSLIIGVIEVGVGIGALIATLFSGYTIKWCSGFMYPELISVVVVFTGIILIVAVLPESLHESRKREDVSIWGNLKRATECYRTDFSPSGKRWMFIILLFIFIMSAFSILGRPNVETIYQMNSPFCWNSVKIGWFGTLRNIAWSFGSMIVIKVFHICTTDEVIAMFGCITSAVSAILEGIASSDLVMYLAAAASIGNIVTMPMVRAIMSLMTPAHKQGSIFAGIAAVEVVCNMMSSILASAVYDGTVAIYKGLTFFVMAGYSIVAFALCWIFLIKRQRTVSEFKINE